MDLFQMELFDEVASATVELETAKAEFIRLHQLIQDSAHYSETFDAIDKANDAYNRWRNAAFSLRDLR